MIEINASIIQGSGMGPILFVITISKLKPIHPANEMVKYADDSNLLVPSENSELVKTEIDHISEWAEACNLKLNQAKTQEMIVRRPRTKLDEGEPEVIPGIKRVKTMKILGVTLSEQLGFDEHVRNINIKARQSMYALRVLAAHGLSGHKLNDVAEATTMARMLYASPAWWGFVGQEGRTRLQATLRRLVRAGYLSDSSPSFENRCKRADTRLFSYSINEPAHVLHELLPPIKPSFYSLRPRAHNRKIPKADCLMRKTFVIRMIYGN
jgi:hypothetical protein